MMAVNLDGKMGEHVSVWHSTVLRKLWKDVRRSRTYTFLQKQHSNHEWLRMCQEFLNMRDCQDVHDWMKKCHTGDGSKKDEVKARDLRLAGNKVFQKKQFKEALKIYNESILSAESSVGSKVSKTEAQDSQLPLCYGNRSAVLYHLQEYKACEEDIERALKHGYPENLRYKLVQRKGQCYYQEGNLWSAEQAFKKAMELCQSSSLEQPKKVSAMKELETMLSKIATLPQRQAQGGCGAGMVDDKVISETFEQSECIANACRSVTLKYSKSHGRYLVANGDIKAGDIVIQENAYAVVLLPTHYGSHCYHCIQPVSMTTIPCPQCTHVRYCSEDCQESSWQRYHHVECPLWLILEQVGSIAQLSLRILLTSGWQNICKYRHLTGNESDDDNCAQDISSKYRGDYFSVYNLMSHSENHPTEYNFYCAMTSILLSKVVTNSLKLMADNPVQDTRVELPWEQERGDKEEGNVTSRSISSEQGCADSRTLASEMSKSCDLGTAVCVDFQAPLADAELSVAVLLLRHMQQLRCNVHAITAVEAEGGETTTPPVAVVESVRQVRLASAVFPTASLLNHGCDPNVIVSYHGNQLTVRATRRISCGEEILHCYGPHVSHMSKDNRQKALEEQYYFTCHCEACENDAKVDLKDAYRCDRCGQAVVAGRGRTPTAESGTLHGQCVNQKCQAEKNLEDAHKTAEMSRKLFSRGVELLEMSEFQESLAMLHKCYKLQQSVLYKHHKEMSDTEDSLARCYVTLGNHEEACKYLKRSIATVGLIHGSKSIELAYELQKLAQIMFNSRQSSTLGVVNRALDIFKIYCGPNHPSVKELSEMKSLLDGL